MAALSNGSGLYRSLFMQYARFIEILQAEARKAFYCKAIRAALHEEKEARKAEKMRANPSFLAYLEKTDLRLQSMAERYA